MDYGFSCFYIDSSKKFNIGRYINHSCSPNCESLTWIDGSGSYRCMIISVKDIEKNSELTYNYKCVNETQICLCGSSNCTGVLGYPADVR